MSAPVAPLGAAGGGRQRGVIALVGAVVLVSGALLLLGGGNVGLAFAPLVLIVAVTAFWMAPLRYVMLGLLAIALAADIPMDRPAGGHWQSPLYMVGALTFDNLNNVVGVSALRFSGLDALIMVLSALIVARAIYGYTRDAAGRVPIPRPLLACLAIAFLAVVWLEMYGLARGGHFKNSLWQVRQLLWTPVLAALFAYALRGPADFGAIAKIVVGSACLKTAFGAYFLFVVAPAKGLLDGDGPAYVTTHGDTTLFVTALAICVACWLQRPSLRHLLLNLTVSPWILFGIVINNRRLAFVSLFGALFIMYVLLRGPIKRRLTALAIGLAPFFMVYVAMGFKRSSGIFGPAAKIASVVTQTDHSSATRDIENYNLIVTLREGRALGSGFGHEYIELSRAFDISHAFALYRYIGHNSVLWLWSIAGVVGFTAIWLMVVAGVFAATRAYHFGRDWSERAAAAAALSAVLAYVMQAWGDMGTQSWISLFLLAAAIAAAGKLAVANGGWPAAAAALRGRAA